MKILILILGVFLFAFILVNQNVVGVPCFKSYISCVEYLNNTDGKIVTICDIAYKLSSPVDCGTTLKDIWGLK